MPSVLASDAKLFVGFISIVRREVQSYFAIREVDVPKRHTSRIRFALAIKHCLNYP